jgi:hypothetical protein
MSILPGPLQITAIVLSLLLPVLLFGYAAIPGLRSPGRRFRAAALTVAGLLLIACLTLPGPRDFGDVIGAVLLLATAIVLCHIFWGLLVWPFMLTLLTAIAKADHPLTLEQWLSACMQGGSPSGFAENRLRLLFGAGMLVSAGDRIVVTQTGMVTARLVRFVRFATGLGSSR